METTRIETAYSPETDMTFILKETMKDNEPVSTEVVGFYYGEPDAEVTQHYIGKLKAEY